VEIHRSHQAESLLRAGDAVAACHGASAGLSCWSFWIREATGVVCVPHPYAARISVGWAVKNEGGVESRNRVSSWAGGHVQAPGAAA